MELWSHLSTLHVNSHANISTYTYACTCTCTHRRNDNRCKVVDDPITFFYTALSGLIITYSTQVISRLPRLVQVSNIVDQEIVSVERVVAYTQLEPEPGYTRNIHPPNDWPRLGSIQLNNVSLRYYPGAPTILKNLNFTIKGGEKVGIVGRTGAGKSSLATALLRMPEPEGEIFIDGVPTSNMNIQDCRRAMTLIPQSPFLFNNTLRRNIDPTGKYTDAKVWRVLKQVQLSTLLEKRGGAREQLNSMVTERGANFSVGERQLICLARALLLKTKIILLDEATANVDYKTDQLIQDIIRQATKEYTVLTIAHRLDTVLDYDRIMVLEDGEIVEMGKPDELLKSNGFFSRLFSYIDSTN